MAWRHRCAIAHVQHTTRRAVPTMSRSFALPRPATTNVSSAPQPISAAVATYDSTQHTRYRNRHHHRHAQQPSPGAMTTRPHRRHRRRHRHHRHLARTHTHTAAAARRPLSRRHRRTRAARRPPATAARAHNRTPSPRAHAHAVAAPPSSRPAHARSRHRPCTCRERSLCETQPALYTHDGIFDNFGPRVQVAGSIARGRCLRRGFAMLHATLGRRECAS
jgi:hypothetical protein